MMQMFEKVAFIIFTPFFPYLKILKHNKIYYVLLSYKFCYYKGNKGKSSNIFKDIKKKKLDILGPTKSFKTMNRSDPA